jgi:DNA-directed RNA polymerase sigma subunit (sigma70/sigma32)
LTTNDWNNQENPCYWFARDDYSRHLKGKRAAMAKDPKIPKTNPDEIEALIERLEQHKLDRQDEELIKRLLRFVPVLAELVERKNLYMTILKGELPCH